MKRRALLVACIVLLQLAFLPSHPVKANATTYNSDGDFNMSSYSLSGSGSAYSAPWGSAEWGISAFAWLLGCPGTDHVDSYQFSAGSGVGHVWLQMTHSVSSACGVSFPVGVARFIQGRDEGGADWNTPSNMATKGKEIILKYRLTPENVALDTHFYQPSEIGVLIDVRLTSPELSKDLLIDLYVYSQCQNIQFTADPACVQEPGYMGENHPSDAEVYLWRIRGNPTPGAWISDVLDISSIIDISAKEAYCYEQTGNSFSSQCTGYRPEASVFHLEPLAEAFSGQSGVALDYVYLLSQTGDADSGGDAGNNFNTATSIGTGTYYGDLDSISDAQDWYQFYAATGSLTTVSVTPNYASLYKLELYNPSGALIAGTYPSSGGQQATVQITACTSGNWRARVFTDPNMGSGAYSISVSLDPGHSCGGGGGSVMAGTMILMSDGTSTPVQNLAASLIIRTFSPPFGGFFNATITSVVTKTVNNLYVIGTNEGIPIRVDYFENFWVLLPSGQEQWMHAGEIQLGYQILRPSSNAWANVTSLSVSTGTFTVYDLIIMPTLPGGPMPVVANGYLDMK